MKKLIFLIVTLFPFQVAAQCPPNTVYFYGYCCLPDFSACINPNTGEILTVPRGPSIPGGPYSSPPPSSGQSRGACLSDCTFWWGRCNSACRSRIILDDEDIAAQRNCHNQCDSEKSSCEAMCR